MHLGAGEISKIRRRHHCDKLKFSNDSYIAQPKAHDFLQEVWLNKPSKRFMAEYACGYTIDSIGGLQVLGGRSLNLTELLVRFIDLSSNINSNIKMGLDVLGNQLALRFEFPEEKSLGKRILEQLWLLICLDLFKKYFGSRWSPTELHVPGYRLEGVLELLPHGVYPIKYEQSEYCIFIEDKTCLDRNHTKIQFPYERGYKEVFEDDLENLQHILMSYNTGYRPTLDDIAVQFKVSARSIKRILEHHNTTFRKLSGDCLLRKALDKLSKRSLTIEEISDSLGYSDSPNFIRSFKSWTGITPAVYRESLSLAIQ